MFVFLINLNTEQKRKNECRTNSSAVQFEVSGSKNLRGFEKRGGGPKIIFRKYLTVTSHCLDCANKFQMCSRMMVLGESEAEAENHRVDQ